MNKDILTELTTGILDAGYSDLEYLVDTIEQYKLEVDTILDDAEQEFGKEQLNDINYLIYIALSMTAQKFIESHTELFEDKSDAYEIFTNYLDSHIYFTDEEAQSEFERF